MAASSLAGGCVYRQEQVEKVPLAVPVSPVAGESLSRGVDDKAPVPMRKLIPDKPEPWQARPPCMTDYDERAISGACWQATSKKPPCGALYEHRGECFRPIQKTEREPSSISE